MLKMLIYNKEHKEKQRDAGGILPPYTSCPNLKMENVQGHTFTALSPGGELYDRNSTFSPNQQNYANPEAPHYAQYPSAQPSFNYNRYMQELAQKLGDHALFSGRESSAGPQHHRFESFGSGLGPDPNAAAQAGPYTNHEGLSGPEMQQ